MRKIWILTIVAVIGGGCLTINESDNDLVLEKKLTAPVALKLEKFQLILPVKSGSSASRGIGVSYDFWHNSWRVSPGVSATNYKSEAPSPAFDNLVKDTFEELGFNISGNNPELILEGRIGNHKIYAPGLWRDIPVDILGIATLGGIWSKTIENTVSIVVRDKKGNRLGAYASTRHFNIWMVSLPLGLLFEEKIVNPDYAAIRATQYALHDCVQEFQADLSAGKFDVILKAK